MGGYSVKIGSRLSETISKEDFVGLVMVLGNREISLPSGFEPNHRSDSLLFPYVFTARSALFHRDRDRSDFLGIYRPLKEFFASRSSDQCHGIPFRIGIVSPVIAYPWVSHGDVRELGGVVYAHETSPGTVHEFQNFDDRILEILIVWMQEQGFAIAQTGHNFSRPQAVSEVDLFHFFGREPFTSQKLQYPFVFNVRVAEKTYHQFRVGSGFRVLGLKLSKGMYLTGKSHQREGFLGIQNFPQMFELWNDRVFGLRTGPNFFFSSADGGDTFPW